MILLICILLRILIDYFSLREYFTRAAAMLHSQSEH